MPKPASLNSCLTHPCSGFVKQLSWFDQGIIQNMLFCLFIDLVYHGLFADIFSVHAHISPLSSAGVFIDLFVWSLFKAGTVKRVLLWLVAKAALQLFRVNGRVETFLMGSGTITQQRKPQLPRASWHKQALEDPAQFPSCQNWHTLIFHPEPLENSPLKVRKLILKDLLSWI